MSGKSGKRNGHNGSGSIFRISPTSCCMATRSISLTRTPSQRGSCTQTQSKMWCDTKYAIGSDWLNEILKRLKPSMTPAELGSPVLRLLPLQRPWEVREERRKTGSIASRSNQKRPRFSIGDHLPSSQRSSVVGIKREPEEN
ncbi:hypothetical protein M407DRAFT_159911 [Tulasnella calospora MUT 4182]|uniref:Uncharacterized protein n=1 Tax=Tulasnella calospora MUT 4182 TaxID=1051891 RepID=A0A0C3QP92_9AGAM|nr:hypothetical protein M407DRAFT_159911 [Tulasnella calospora MUT 4182]